MTEQGTGQGHIGPAPAGNELILRLISALALMAIGLIGAIFGGWAAAIVLAVLSAIFHLEWVSLTDRSPWPGAVFTVSLVLAIAMTAMGLVVGALILVALAIGFSALTFSVWRPIGVAYAAMLGMGLLVLRLTPQGLPAVLLVLAVVWATDTGAYFIGRFVGGAKLAPRISPNKTQSGAIGGLVVGILAGLIVVAVAGLPLTGPLIVVMGFLSVVSQAGDLFESFVKRTFGAKDSGNLIPGHGGLMDRLDGLAVASGVAAIIGWVHAGPNVAAGLLTW